MSITRPGLCFSDSAQVTPGSHPLVSHARLVDFKCVQLFSHQPHGTVEARLGTHPPVAGEKDGVALDVPVDDALVVQVGQGSQDGQADGGDLLLVHPETVKGKNELSVNEDGGKGDKEGQGTSPWSHQSVDGSVDTLVLFLSKQGESKEQVCNEVWISLPAALKKQSVRCAAAWYREPVFPWEITEMPYLQ